MSDVSGKFELVPAVAGYIDQPTCIVCGLRYSQSGLLLESRRRRDGEDGEEQESYGSICPSCLRQGAERVKQAASCRAEDMALVATALRRVQTWPEIPPFGWRPEFES